MRPCVSILLLLLGVLASPGSAREPTALEVFEAHYADADPAVRKRAVTKLERERGPRAVAALLRALGDDDDGVRRKAAALLCEQRDRPDEIEALVRLGLGKRPDAVRRDAARALAAAGEPAHAAIAAALGDRQPGVRRVAARALGRLGALADVPLLRCGLADREALVRAEMLASIGRIQGAAAFGAALSVLTNDRGVAPRVVAAGILARHPRMDGIAPLGGAARDPAWSVRTAAARALGECGGTADLARAAAAALVAAHAAETRQRVREEQSDALFLLTGIDFGPAPDRWSAWFADVGTTFEPPARRPHRPVTRARTPRGTVRSGGGHLLDLPLGSEHVCFVLDCSRSMNDPAERGASRTDDTTKRRALLRAFERVVVRFEPGTYMNLITFGSEPRRFRPSLFAANRRARRAAIQYLDDTVPDGRTNIWDALALAFEDEDTDTIVLASDGAPSAGARQSRGEILAGLRDLNRFRLVRVHTVEIGAANTGSRWAGFLAEIAEATGGRHLLR